MNELEVGRVIGEYGAAHADEWAGMWLQSEVFLAGFTANLDAHREALEALVGSTVRVVSARWTVADLERVEEEIFRSVVDERGMNGIGPSAELNRVRVSVKPVSVDLAARLRHDWGDYVTVVHERVVNRAL